MIYTQVNGRCGNQLFRYAFTQKLQRLYKEEACFDYSWINMLHMEDETYFDNLEEFNVDQYTKIEEKKNLVLKFGSLKQKIVYCIYRLWFCELHKKHMDMGHYFRQQNNWQSFMNFFGIYNLDEGDAPIKMSKEKNKFVLGYYENKIYFDDLYVDLKRQFVPKEISRNNDELFQIIKDKESVCISVRRGDVVSDKQLSKVKNICNEDYYRKAIEKMKAMKKDCVFVFFSDDIEWCKKNFNFGEESFYESGQDSISEKLRLMSACKNFIVSNSTFSWWAQYLSDEPDKVVISPDHWFNYENFKHPLIDDSWILIECK